MLPEKVKLILIAPLGQSIVDLQRSLSQYRGEGGVLSIISRPLPTPSFFSWTLAVPPSPLGAPGVRPGSQGDSRRQHRPGYGWPGKYLFHPPQGAGCLFPPHPRRNHRLRMPSELSWLPGLHKPLKLGVGKFPGRPYAAWDLRRWDFKRSSPRSFRRSRQTEWIWLALF